MLLPGTLVHVMRWPCGVPAGEIRRPGPTESAREAKDSTSSLVSSRLSSPKGPDMASSCLILPHSPPEAGRAAQ